MNVAFFSNQFAVRRGHGIARYAHRLYEALGRTQPDIHVTPAASWSDHDAQGVRALKERFGLRLLPWGRRWTPLAWTFLDWPPIENWLEGSIDVVHAVAMGFPVATRKPLVVTVHDIGPLTHPEFFSQVRPWVSERSLKQAVEKADAILCVSRATADEVELHVGGGLGNRLQVIYEGVARRFFEPPNTDCLMSLEGMPEGDAPFLMAAGKISPRKNIARVIQALAMLGDAIPHYLVLVGGSGWDADETLGLMNNPAIAERIHFLGYVSDEQLHALYSSASAYIHPSLFEGFGLTVLEAMAAGCPVVTSNVSSLPEVAGEAALLVDPMDLTAMADAIQTICLDESLAESLIARGRARAATFTWDRCAEQVARVYRSVGG